MTSLTTFPEQVTICLDSDNPRGKPYKDLDITDDFMFKKFFEIKENCLQLLHILLGIPLDTKIAEPVSQSNVHPGDKKDRKEIFLDIRTSDDVREFDIEMQKKGRKSIPKRARYYQAAMDVAFLQGGRGYETLKENVILFICMKNIFKSELPILTFRNTCQEDGKTLLDDGTIKVFYNAEKYDKLTDTEAKNLMSYFYKRETPDSFTQKIEDFMMDAKENPVWSREYLDNLMYETEVKELKEGIAERDAKLAEKEARIKELEKKLAEATA